MTTDYDKLRELAEAARDAKLAYLATENERAWDALMAAMDALGQALQPEAILAILDALKAATERAERAERERDDARTMMGTVGELLYEANAKIRDNFYREAWRCLVARVDRDGGQRMMEDEDEAVTTERIDREIVRLLGVERERDEARAERDARVSVPLLPGDFDHIGIDYWSTGSDGEACDRFGDTIEALRAHARKAVEP